MPKVSIVMPVYNTSEAYFREAIESVLAQTFTDFELLIIDDCSKPYIEKIVKSYNNQRIKYIRLSVNSGASKARNVGIDSAKGSYIAFLDSDDVWLPTKLEEQVRFLTQHPTIGCLGTKVEVIGNDAPNSGFKNSAESHEKIELGLVVQGCMLCQSTVIIRKSVLDKNHVRYKPKYVPSEDYAFYLDLIGKTKFHILPLTLVQYRCHLDNISHRKEKEQLEKYLMAKREALLRYFKPKPRQKELPVKFFLGLRLNYEEIKCLKEFIPQVQKNFASHGLSNEEIKELLKKKLINIYHHTHSLKAQAQLLQMPFAPEFGLSFFWRLGCFITRGLF